MKKLVLLLLAPLALAVPAHAQYQGGPVTQPLNRSSCNTPGGVACLDEQGRMNAPIQGLVTLNGTTVTNPAITGGTIQSADVSKSNVTVNVSPNITGLAPVPRPFSDRLRQYVDIKDYGITLDGSAGDQTRIDAFYSAISNDGVIHIPIGGNWQGTISNPNPSKHLTWIFEGASPDVPIGDGDTHISVQNGLTVKKRLLNTSAFYSYPITAWLWNADPNFNGVYQGNYQGYSAFLARSISGPTASGNTSSMTSTMDSYGMNPAQSYDVNTAIVTNKHGQNSVWGLLVQTMDDTMHPPSAFSAWNEYDIWANGKDRFPDGPNYGSLTAGNRSFFYLNGSHLKRNTWQYTHDQGGSHLIYSAPNSCQTCLPTVRSIRVKAPDGIDYVWYNVKAGTMGDTLPAFPSPNRFLASYNAGGTTLTVTSMISGTIHTGDIVTGAVPVAPVHIVSQLTSAAPDGSLGGVGTYQLEQDARNFSAQGIGFMYSAPDVADGTTLWRFGEEYFSTIESVLFVTASGGTERGDSYGSIVAVDSTVNITDAVVDSSSASFNSDAAVIRMASSQVIDFSSQNSLTSRNKHTLGYTVNGSVQALTYTANGVVAKSIYNNGAETKTLSDGVAAAGTTLATATALSNSEVSVVTAGSGGVSLHAYIANGRGVEQTVTNETGNTISVYPPAAGWNIMNLAQGAGYPVSAWSTRTFVNTGRFNNHIIVK